jgi:predicted MFS family arabinose efflux permease
VSQKRAPLSRAVRGAVVAWACSVTADMVTLVALLVVAYDTGGPALVALWSGARLLPAVIVAPLLVGRCDTGGRRRWLGGVLATRTVLTAAAVVALLLDQPAVALVLGVLVAVLAITHRPMHAALLPVLTATPSELTRANATSSLGEALGTVAGPALTALLLLAAGPVAGLALATLLLGVGVLALRVVPPDGPRRPHEGDGQLRRLVGGLQALGRVPLVPALLAAQAFAEGAIVVGVVVVAVEVLDLGDSAVGWITALLGVGGIVGAVVTTRRARSTALARTFAVGVALWGAPMALVGLATHPVVVVVAALAVGVANAMTDVGSYTLVARLVPASVLGSALGAFASVHVIGSALGAWGAGLLVPALGITGMLVVVGVAVVVVALVGLLPAVRTDRGLTLGEHVDVLAQTPLLAALPRLTLEQLAHVTTQHRFGDGAVVMAQGEPGEQFHVVVDGRAQVAADGRALAVLGPGDGFGEIALLRDVPRTATVTALGPLVTVALTREQFVPAVTGNLGAAAAAAVLTESRLAAQGRPHDAAP